MTDTSDEKTKKERNYLPRSYGNRRSRRGRRRNAHYADTAVARSTLPESPPQHADEDRELPLVTAETNTQDDPSEEYEPENENDYEDMRNECLSEEAEDSADALPQELLEEEASPPDAHDPDAPARLMKPPIEVSPPPDKELVKVIVNLVGIRFDYAGKIYHFDAEEMKLDADEWVIVKTEKGIGLGSVAMPSQFREVEAFKLDSLRKVVRRAGKVDFERREACKRKEAEAHAYCLERIEALGLPMKLVSVECFFDGSKYVFFFTAEGRVDFRELVKQLVARYPVRIEMRQIGVRHESKMTGGLACCGQELCCSRFLTEFRPVSVKMAKNQNLSLNPSKISGACGRLMCCLAYEHEIYENFKRGLPKVGKPVCTSKGCGMMVKHNPLEETALIRLDDDSTVEVRKEDVLADAASAPKQNDQQAAPARKEKRPAKKRGEDANGD